MKPIHISALAAAAVAALGIFIWSQEREAAIAKISERPAPEMRSSSPRLVPCRACRFEISENAAACPRCGEPR